MSGRYQAAQSKMVQDPSVQLSSRQSGVGRGFSDYSVTELMETWIILELCNEGSLQVCFWKDST